MERLKETIQSNPFSTLWRFQLNVEGIRNSQAAYLASVQAALTSEPSGDKTQAYSKGKTNTLDLEMLTKVYSIYQQKANIVLERTMQPS